MEATTDIIREVLKSNEFHLYFNSLDKKVREKYDYAIHIMRTQKVVSTKFIKKLQNSEFFEVRVSTGTNEYRTLLIATDSANFIEAKRIVLLNSFLKKGSNQYNREIEKAKKILIKEEII
jgi:NADPH-dependent 7-cyano-7-deazaguanine reductase QueF-like protein